jgi:hypothetical protein
MKPVALVCTILLLFVEAAVAVPPPPDLSFSLPFEGPMALAVLDARPDVVNGERKETFIGLTRSLYGIPFQYHTRSKKPFAQDLSDLVSRALKQGKTPLRWSLCLRSKAAGSDRRSPEERSRTPDPPRNPGLVVGHLDPYGSALRPPADDPQRARPGARLERCHGA